MRRAFALVAVAAALAAADPSPPTAAEIAAIDLSDARGDDGWVAPVAATLDGLEGDRVPALAAFRAGLDAWPPAAATEPLALTHALLNAAALADMGRSPAEAEAARVVMDRLLADPRRADILAAAALIALGRDGMTPVAAAPELGLATTSSPADLRARVALYAKKLVGRCTGVLPSR